MHVSEVVVERLVAGGIEAVFGIPGTQTLPLNEAIEAHTHLRFVMARHETAVSHAAWGYAETSGRPAATVVVPGPGDMNAMNGLKNALNDNAPVVHLAVETEAHLRGADAIHETPPSTYDTVVKANELVERAHRVGPVLDRAIDVALEPPIGPVRVGIAKDVLARGAPTTGTADRRPAGRGTVPAEAVGAAAEAIAAAEAPVVIAGGGVRTAGAGDELVALADRLDAPVVTTYKGKGTFPEDDPRSAGVLGGAASAELLELLAESDVGVVVGSDLDAVATHGLDIELPPALVHVTVEPDDVATGYEPTVALVADARDTLEALLEALPAESEPDGSPGRARVVRTAVADRIDDLVGATEPPLPSPAVLAGVRAALPREAVVSIDAGGFRLWALATFPAYGSRSIVTPGSWATMGSGLPGAIGAALARPDVPVAAITGDGGLLMCLHELHTLAAEDLPVTVVVLNNDDYAVISEEAVRAYDLDRYDWPERAVSFVAVAEGLGVDAVRATTPADVRGAVEAAVRADGPRLVEVPTDPDEPQVSGRLR